MMHKLLYCEGMVCNKHYSTNNFICFMGWLAAMILQVGTIKGLRAIVLIQLATFNSLQFEHGIIMTVKLVDYGS